jgi:soluble lytic murein transglycosylase-like protein
VSVIIALILTIATEMGLPPYFVLAIALEENSTLDPLAVNVNANDTVDRGIMQLNSSWYNGDWQCPQVNIRAGCEHIRELANKPGINTWFGVAIAYNAGYGRINDPPQSTLTYASNVMERYSKLTNGNIEVVIRGKW